MLRFSPVKYGDRREGKEGSSKRQRDAHTNCTSIHLLKQVQVESTFDRCMFITPFLGFSSDSASQYFSRGKAAPVADSKYDLQILRPLEEKKIPDKNRWPSVAFQSHFIKSDMNKLIQSAGSTMLDAVPTASNLAPFVEHVLPPAFGIHSLFWINEITYSNNTKNQHQMLYYFGFQ